MAKRERPSPHYKHGPRLLLGMEPLKRLCPDHEVSVEFRDALWDHIEQMIFAAQRRATFNKRKRVMARDV